MLMLLDMPYLAHAAQYAVGPLSYKGKNTGVIYGTLDMMKGLIEAFKPHNVVLCWDSKESLRKELYPEYKGNRKPSTPEEFAERVDFQRQCRILRKILPSIGFNTQSRQLGYEADDVIATTANKHAILDNVLIVSGDHDLYQLLGKNVRIWALTRRKMTTRKSFIEEYGIKPEKWHVVKAMAGCSSDNVAGISGIGDKTAIKFIRNELKESSKAYQSIKSNSELIERNKLLVTLPLKGVKPVKMKTPFFNEEAFQKMRKKYGMKSMRMEEWSNLFKILNRS